MTGVCVLPRRYFRSPQVIEGATLKKKHCLNASGNEKPEKVLRSKSVLVISSLSTVKMIYVFDVRCFQCCSFVFEVH